MVEFKFTKLNGTAPINTIVYLANEVAITYQKIGLGHIVTEEPKKKTKKK